MANKLPPLSSYGRSLKPSAKVRENELEAKEYDYDEVHRKLTASSNQLCALLEEQAPKYMIRELYGEWQNLYEEFTNQNLLLLHYLPTYNVARHTQKHQHRLGVLRSYRDQIEKYIRVDKPRSPAQPGYDDELSQHSTGTARSTKKQLGELDRQTRQLEKQIEQISATLGGLNLPDPPPVFIPNYVPSSILGPRYASTPGAEKVQPWLSQLTEANFRKQPQPSPAYQPRPPRIDQGMPEPALRRRSLPTLGLDPTIQVLNKLADILKEEKKQLPPREPDVFGGELTDFTAWFNSFEELVEVKLEYPRDGLNYLAKYTEGLAKATIKGFLNLGSDRAYFDAKHRLTTRFGNRYKIAEAYRLKLREWPSMKKGDVVALQDYSDFLWQCYSAMDSIEFLGSLNSSEENIRMMQKLPQYLAERWNRTVVKYCNQGCALWSGEFYQGYPPFLEYCVFISAELQVAEGPCNLQYNEFAKKENPTSDRQQPSGKKKPSVVSAFSTDTASSTSAKSSTRPPSRPPYCIYCKREQHYISTCEVFLALDSATKTAFAKQRGLCFGCLRRTHMYKECRSKNPSLLKDKSAGAKAPEITANVTGAESKTDSNDLGGTDSELIEQKDTLAVMKTMSEKTSATTMIIPLVVTNKENGKKAYMYGVIDAQSDGCFLNQEIADQLEFKQRPVNLTLTTMSSSEEVHTTVLQNLMVQGLGQPYKLDIAKCYTRDKIPCNPASIPTPEEARNWPHLQSIAAKIPKYQEDWPVGIMISNKYPVVFRYDKCVWNKDDEPFACRTVLGWSIIGPKKEPSERDGTPSQAFCHHAETQEITAAELRDVFDSDFSSMMDEQKMSKEDQQFLKILSDGLERLPNGHYQLPLPFKKPMPSMPDNRQCIKNQTERMRKRLQIDPTYRDDYVKAMEMNINKGFVERVPENELIVSDGRVNYIGHHGVYHPQKPGTVRPVYNASLVFQGVSLNNLLLTGPDLTNNMTGILIRFREELVVIACDIEKMFYQVYVAPNHRNYLRFFWFEDSDPSKPLVEYRFLVHTFGVASSPGCVNFALKTTADQFEEKHGSLAADFIRRFFYVDDGIKGVPDIATGVSLVKSGHELCLEGGFRLVKFLSNSREVMAQIPKELLAKEVQEVDFTCPNEQLPVGRSLGCIWAIENDQLQFRIALKTDQLLTRRTMLSTIGSIYDPLGLAGPVLLRGRRLLQRMCQMELGWDEVVPDEMQTEWSVWIEELLLLKNFELNRCYRTGLDGELTSVQLHHFSDASMSGHGCCSYLRLQDEHGKVAVNLVMAKAKVNPSKAVTIPRLELQSAVLAVVMSEFLQRELTYTNIHHFFWSDSTVILGYISNQSKRFHIYVANRVQRIQDSTSPEQCFHVSTRENPADIASRGHTSAELLESSIWWKGPPFLKTFNEEMSRAEPASRKLVADDPEIRIVKTVLQTSVQFPPMLVYYSNVSEWKKLVRGVALWKKYTRILRDKVKKIPRQTQELCVADLVHAHHLIIKHVQKNEYLAEYKILEASSYDPNDVTSRTHRLKRSSQLYRLDPYMDNQQIVRVGGRIRRSELLEILKHPILLPNRAHVTQMIIAQSHEEVKHSGTGITLNQVRTNGYWIIHSRSAVRRYISKCVTCNKLRKRPAVQIMADLPDDRLQHKVPPFTFCGVDLFGPVMVKRGRVDIKRWICLFTDLVMRAIHLEVVFTLTTDSFLNAYRRFVNRRGPIRLLRCDQGTNFVGAQNDLKKALEEMDHHRIKKTLEGEGCDWIKFQYNAPKASYQGGAWERLIGVTKRVLDGILINHREKLNDELLLTFLMEVEYIVNSRPITYLDTTSTEECALSPAQLLTMKSKVIMPLPGNFMKQDVYCRKRWRFIQYLVNLFWQQWIKTYIPTIQERRKWNVAVDNIKCDDLVLIVDENLPRGKWLLGRITSAVPDKDGGVRRVHVRTANSILERPIQKIILLLRPKPSIRDDSPSRSQ